MKRFNLSVVLPILFLSLWQPGPVMAQQDNVYNLASIQPDKRIEIEPGRQGSSLIYFYNVDGNHATHIRLEVSSSPSNWEIEIQPSSQERVIDTADGSITLIENLCVEPSTLQPERIEGLGEGLDCVAVPDRGYAVAEVVRVTIQLPRSAIAGDMGEVVVTAEAVWLGQAAAASIRQTRDFVFGVEVLPVGPGVNADGNREASVTINQTEKTALILTLFFSLFLLILISGIAKSTKND